MEVIPGSFDDHFKNKSCSRSKASAFVVKISLSPMCERVHAQLLSCAGLCNPLDCSPPGCSVQGISQARIPEWVAVPSSRGSSQPRDQTLLSQASWTGTQVLYHEQHLGSPSSPQECSMSGRARMTKPAPPGDQAIRPRLLASVMLNQILILLVSSFIFWIFLKRNIYFGSSRS